MYNSILFGQGKGEMPHKHTVSTTTTTVDKYDSESTKESTTESLKTANSGELSTPDQRKSMKDEDSPVNENAAPAATLKAPSREPFSVSFVTNMHSHANNNNDVSQSNETKTANTTDAKTSFTCTCCDKLVAFFGC